jgi:hypothetical protein
LVSPISRFLAGRKFMSKWIVVISVALGSLWGSNPAHEPTPVLAAPATATAAPATVATQDSTWLTDHELSGNLRTPRFEATVAYCERLAAASAQLHFTRFGESPQGRPLPLLVADRQGNFTPEAVHGTRNAVVLVQACIHAGECCGKDAGLRLLRDLTVTNLYPDLLAKVTVLFIPIFNVDGHERFGPHNRINQNGPVEMGWRATAQNLNLNRDFLKADTPEMQAWLRLVQLWQPDFFIDTHSTDGADFQYAITYAMETHGSMHPAVTEWTRNYLARLEPAMAAAGFPISPYVMLRDWHDVRSGIDSWVALPRFSQGYLALHDVPGLLVEAHMLKPYPVRVEGVYQTLLQTLRILAEENSALKQARATAREEMLSPKFREQPLPLRFAVTDAFRTIDFLGVACDIVDSELSGGKWHRYGEEPVVYQIPYYDQQEAQVFADLPQAYIVPPEWEQVIARLRWHGVQVKQLQEPIRLEVRSYRLREISWREQPYEGRHPVTFQTDEIQTEREYPAGSAVIDIRQPAVKVAAHCLEPHAPDSFLYWGFFDAVCSRVEYFESYVMEDMARDMLAADPSLRVKFEQKKATDAEFAASPRAILNWFYERSPYVDARYRIYPVGWIDDRDVLESLPLQVQR